MGRKSRSGDQVKDDSVLDVGREAKGLRITGFDERAVHKDVVDIHVGEQTAITIMAVDVQFEIDRSVENESRGKSSGSIGTGLTDFRGINADETDLLTGVKSDCISVYDMRNFRRPIDLDRIVIGTRRNNTAAEKAEKKEQDRLNHRECRRYVPVNALVGVIC